MNVLPMCVRACGLCVLELPSACECVCSSVTGKPYRSIRCFSVCVCVHRECCCVCVRVCSSVLCDFAQTVTVRSSFFWLLNLSGKNVPSARCVTFVLRICPPPLKEQ